MSARPSQGLEPGDMVRLVGAPWVRGARKPPSASGGERCDVPLGVFERGIARFLAKCDACGANDRHIGNPEEAEDAAEIFLLMIECSVRRLGPVDIAARG